MCVCARARAHEGGAAESTRSILVCRIIVVVQSVEGMSVDLEQDVAALGSNHCHLLLGCVRLAKDVINVGLEKFMNFFKHKAAPE